MSALAEFGSDLTAAAAAGKLDPMVGRDAELRRVIRVLARKTKNNPVLLGEPGVGKTAVVEGLASRIVEGRVPGNLVGVTIFALNLGSLLAGTGYRGDFEQRLQDMVSELRKPGRPILLFIDEIHLLAKAGRSEGGLDAANMLKPMLARGELPCIGASTTAEWSAMVSMDPALERRFQPVFIEEPSPAVTLKILQALRSRYEVHHGVRITDEALAAAVEESRELAPGRRFPDKAVDLLDEACAMVRLDRAEETLSDPGLNAELALAERRFDLQRVAELRRRVRQTASQAPPAVLDPAAVRRVRREAG